MRKLLWIGDAVAATGFARCTHNILEVLRQTWDVGVLGLNYMGDPHQFPYRIYPCWPGGDAFGMNRVKAILELEKPDLIVIQNDPWNLAGYLRRIPKGIPVVAALAVDGKNCKLGGDLERLDKEREKAEFAELTHAIFWTDFARREARRGGGNQTWGVDVVPLGVDVDVYKPMDRIEARKAIGIPEHLFDAFIVGNVNRNQPRKRLDLTIQYFAEWVRYSRSMDSYLLLHVAPTGDQGYDLRQLKRYYDPGREWLILVEPDIGTGAPEALMPLVYNSFDAQMTTTQGEGWGLTTMEGMACGIPQITPQWSALEEWTGSATLGVRCPTTIATHLNINSIGGVPDKDETVRALDLLYRNERFRNSENVRSYLATAGRNLVCEPKYRWNAIGERYAEILDDVLQTWDEDRALEALAAEEAASAKP